MDDLVLFGEPLNSHLQTNYTENFAYQVLKSCYPERYTSLLLNDAPDLQMPDKSVGIEVTLAVSAQIAEINGVFTNYRIGKQNTEAKEQCRHIIEDNGGKIEDFGLSYPVQTLKGEQNVFRAAIQRKMKKLESYRRKGFCQIGLFMLYEEIPIPPLDIQRDWLQWFDDAQEVYEDKYDFLYFCYPNDLLTYYFSTGSYHVNVIGRERYGELSKAARLMVEHK